MTPLLAYPLGVPMNEHAKRAQLEQAVKRLLTEGPGAMMGSTILSVDAAELGDRAMLDSLLAHSYRPHLKGPFLMLSETPTNDAVNFVTGAGGFLQQVIFGWTGLRVGDNGLDPAFPALLPSHISRLVLRNVGARGKRFDVVVDSGGRRIIRAWRQLGRRRSGAPTAGARVPGTRCGRSGGLWGLPDQVLPRLEEQHGTDLPGAPRCTSGQPLRRRGEREHRVHRSRRPGPTRVVGVGGRDRAGRGFRGDASRPVHARRRESRVELGWFVLGSMRVERDFQYWRRHLEPFTGPPFRVPEESLLVADVAGLPAEERPKHLEALDAERLDELRARLLPTIRMMSATRRVAGPGGTSIAGRT